MADPNDYLPPAPQARAAVVTPAVATTSLSHAYPDDFTERVEHVTKYLYACGFVFEPWQVAAFITAVRTKPFVILAGISGTGKTKLPGLVSDATGADCVTVPVRPDWNDSGELLGFERLDKSFQPGALLRVARRAYSEPEKQFFLLLDEMNIARVEYYLAEVLSHLEERRPDNSGRVVSRPLMPHLSDIDGAEEWAGVRLPDNLCIVGSVNMDETTYGFSRKVLDRAFVIEFSQVDLSAVADGASALDAVEWPSADWKPRAQSLATHPGRSSEVVTSIIETLTRLNFILEQGQLQFGYRVRDEIIMFCLAAQECPEAFVTADAGTVDPLDLAIAMKVLPRVQGGGATIRKLLENLREWASPSTDSSSSHSEEAEYPFCADRLSLMLRRLDESGFTSFWF